MTRTTRLFWPALVCWAGRILWLSALTPQELPDAAFIVRDRVSHLLADVLGAGAGAVASIPTQRRLHRRPSA